MPKLLFYSRISFFLAFLLFSAGLTGQIQPQGGSVTTNTLDALRATNTAKANLTATSDPTASSDQAAGYSVGSTWINTATGRLFVCTSSAVGAAVWAASLPGTVTGSNVALPGKLTVGTTVVDPVKGVATSTVAAQPVTASSHHAFGDSITVGTGASVVTKAYISLLTQDEGVALTNRGVSGAQACDMAQAQVFLLESPGDSRQPTATLMIGANDADFKGAGAYEAVYNNCHQAAISWMAISASYKVMAQNAACVQGGTWANDNATYLTGEALKSSTNASTLACTITTTGGPLYAWYRITDANGGVFTYSLDGGTAVSLNAFTTPAIATRNSGTDGTALLRIPSVSAGSHTLTFTVTSATSGSNVVTIVGVGATPALNRYGMPRVFVGGVLRQQNDTKASDTLAYNADALANVNLLYGDGLGVYFADVRSYVNSTTDMFNSLHPNDSGHGHLRDAFEQAEQYTPGGTGVSPAPPADPSTYFSTNLGNLASTTALNPGVNVFNQGGTNFFGMDLGYDGSTYYLRTFTPSIYSHRYCSYTNGAAPTLQSSFTCWATFAPAGISSALFFDTTSKAAFGPAGFFVGTASKFGFSSTGLWSGSVDTAVTRAAAGVVAVGTGGAASTAGAVAATGYYSYGTPSIAGCSVSALTGGNTYGQFTSGTTGTCTVTFTFSYAATNGFACSLDNVTTHAAYANDFHKTGGTNSTVIESATTNSGDVITYQCGGY